MPTAIKFKHLDKMKNKPYNEEDIRSYCGYCKQQFDAEIYLCPNCGSNLVNYNTGMRTEEFAVQDRWERHNRNFKSDKDGKDGEALKS
ncbi:MAG: hypothetical protein JWN83_2300 [Chitinophagaceae bacterium]|nr:hypothetical protein [Chitinophagaceae bacterium]